MPRGVCLALFSLFFYILSCTPSGLIQRPGESSQPTNQETSYLEKEELSNSTHGELNLLGSSIAQDDSPANGASPADMLAKEAEGVDPEEEPYTDQKRIDDALYYYQEALESWNSGEPDKAIESLDQRSRDHPAKGGPPLTHLQTNSGDLRLQVPPPNGPQQGNSFGHEPVCGQGNKTFSDN